MLLAWPASGGCALKSMREAAAGCATSVSMASPAVERRWCRARSIRFGEAVPPPSLEKGEEAPELEVVVGMAASWPLLLMALRWTPAASELMHRLD
jgi:hypothetical protein